MRLLLLTFLLGEFCCFSIGAQQILIKGSVKEEHTFNPIQEVAITIEETNQTTYTNILGEFIFTSNIPLGEQMLRVSKTGYITKRYPIIVNENETVNITDITLEFDVSEFKDLFTIVLSDDELDDDTIGSDNISGLLSSSLDIFQRTAAFEFSASFFRLRGLDSDHGSVLINGVEMNKIYNGRPQWSNWGGLNDVVKNKELTSGLTPSNYNFGGVLGTVNINTRASQIRSGRQVTYSSSNRSYSNRFMATYASGVVKKGWAYALSIGRRWGNEGYQDATLYSSNAFFASVEKIINNKHSLNFTGIYAPNRRGKSSPNTQEVYNLKGIKYNEYWGWQESKKRNSRIKEVEEPVIMLNHYWDINSKTKLNTNIGYQFGKLGNSRLAYGGTNSIVNTDGTVVFESGGLNPSPTYYQKLPSYFERNFPNDLEFAYGAQQEFLNNGQINWQQMYDANLINTSLRKVATYMLYEDRVDDKVFAINTTFNAELKENVTFNASINYKKLESKNYAQVLDLLGGSGFLNVDSFDGVQFDLKNPNTIVGVGDVYGYHYNMFANIISAYAQAQFKYNTVDFFISGSVTSTQYQREGLFQHETFQDNSFGKGETLPFTGLGVKAGGIYKITGKHLIDVNTGWIIRAPSIRNSYSNSRANHNIVPNISEEKIMSLDASYIFRSSKVKAKLTGFYTKLEDANEISFFFADGIGHVIAESGTQQSGYDDNEFIQEILQGINKNHLGVELGIEAQITPTIKLKGATSVGQFTYANNPDLYLSSDRFENVYLGTSKLKGYKLAVGPHRAYSIGFEYRDPEYWWFGVTANFFDKIYVDSSPLTRTDNFFTDVDGLPFVDYDEDIAKALLKQEVFDDYMVVNLVGGKSWRVNQYYIGFFASINNVLDAVYKTGGFEQGRNANYRQLRDDQALNKPVFGSKYWYGRGATYFLNVSVKL
ncbi:carboxypeptidase-like regulatory domain-containing protein [Flavivirga aquimarina]|uniref:Carboxypeptidase-like regulatory domain-containing protein n=1 Tax=Flavivirga aquimarina TaxID=2027862 RepID=A0ABT8WGS9_9FLAO|nr:carboxypeptidase-like regulatory domain-containing protein [Flavivirga aquimarina]MDO5972366.1 carboxypeptidase-like regulatory domain-containing protein [Flavivirga aquimarina]